MRERDHYLYWVGTIGHPPEDEREGDGAVAPPPPLRRAGWRLMLRALSAAPAAGLGRAVAAAADARIPGPLRTPIYRAFGAAVGADLTESQGSPRDYATFDDFFTRPLRPGVRSWPEERHVAGCPVDGLVGRFGRITDGLAVQAKGRRYAVSELLGAEANATDFGSGAFLTVYLAPRHYHRVHTPASGSLEATRHIPGRLLPVNAPAVSLVDRLFVTNERTVCLMRTDAGRVAVVAVGATNVGRISVPPVAGWNPERDIGTHRVHDPSLPLERGDPLMVFHLGSTVVLLFEGWRLRPELARGAEIRLGTPIAEPG